MEEVEYTNRDMLDEMYGFMYLDVCRWPGCDVPLEGSVHNKLFCEVHRLSRRLEIDRARVGPPEYKAWWKAYERTPKRKAWWKAYRQTPERKAYMRASDKARNQTPERKASDKARNQTPERKAYMRAYQKARNQTPEYKAYQKAYRARKKAEAILEALA